MSHKKKFVDEQLEVIEADLKATKPGTAQYEYKLKVRGELLEQKEKEKRKPIDVKSIVTDIVIPIGTTAVSTAVTLYLAGKYEDVAKMAYGLDNDFKLCNGRVWNLKDKISSLIKK